MMSSDDSIDHLTALTSSTCAFVVTMTFYCVSEVARELEGKLEEEEDGVGVEGGWIRGFGKGSRIPLQRRSCRPSACQCDVQASSDDSTQRQTVTSLSPVPLPFAPVCAERVLLRQRAAHLT